MPPAKNTSNKSEEPKKTPAVEEPTKADDTAVAPPAPNHDDTDVAAALARKTQDGKGGEEVPESNFDSFATEGVERDKSDLDLAHEVLEGKWGYSRTAAFAKLREAGLDTYAIGEEVKRLQDAGKPSTLSN